MLVTTSRELDTSSCCWPCRLARKPSAPTSLAISTCCRGLPRRPIAHPSLNVTPNLGEYVGSRPSALYRCHRSHWESQPSAVRFLITAVRFLPLCPSPRDVFSFLKDARAPL